MRRSLNHDVSSFDDFLELERRGVPIVDVDADRRSDSSKAYLNSISRRRSILSSPTIEISKSEYFRAVPVTRDPYTLTSHSGKCSASMDFTNSR